MFIDYLYKLLHIMPKAWLSVKLHYLSQSENSIEITHMLSKILKYSETSRSQGIGREQ